MKIAILILRRRRTAANQTKRVRVSGCCALACVGVCRGASRGLCLCDSSVIAGVLLRFRWVRIGVGGGWGDEGEFGEFVVVGVCADAC
jgi:hypothetical protein